MEFHRALLIGWRGGVGSALLRLLAGHPAGWRMAGRLAALVLPNWLDADGLARQIELHRIDQVIELADVDTLAFSRVCAARGVDYIAASMQKPGDGEDALTMPAARALLPSHRPDVGDASHLIGTGMNPGVVNALVFAGLAELARRGVPEADLYAIYITEEDTTARAGGDLEDDVFPMSWSPRHALQELLEPHAMYVTHGELARCAHRPHERHYAVRCGPGEIAAMVVPHEEVVTLGARFPTVERAFCYAIPPAAAAALRRHPARELEAWRTHKLYPPGEWQLTGGDRVGVLLCTRSHGELWIGFDIPNARAAPYGTNATLLQTATGLLASWHLLGTRRGVHVVEDLDWRALLEVVEQVLGAPEVHHAPDAPVRPLAARLLARP
jgi:homospermidine synthase